MHDAPSEASILRSLYEKEARDHAATKASLERAYLDMLETFLMHLNGTNTKKSKDMEAAIAQHDQMVLASLRERAQSLLDSDGADSGDYIDFVQYIAESSHD